jgi:DNA processing protein
MALNRTDAAFPQRCLDAEPTIVSLNVLGDIAVLNKPALAIVGARKATPYGLSCAKHFASLAAEMGLVVVSGGAIGCDQAAHRGALRVEGRTIVVLGCGADVIYPRRAAGLFAEIVAGGGAVVSEAPWGSPPSRFGFRRRNRIIAGLGMVTLIVEAGLPSGTFSTADDTLALGRDVLVVPGSIHSRESRGSNRLLLQGALPVVDDESFFCYLSAAVGEALPIAGAPIDPRLQVAISTDSLRPDGTAETGAAGTGRARPDKTENQRASSVLVSALMAEAMTVEEVATVRGIDITAAVRELSALEFTGTVRRLRDGRYTISEQSRYY